MGLSHRAAGLDGGRAAAAGVALQPVRRLPRAARHRGRSPLTGGGQPADGDARARSTAGRVVCLLADRTSARSVSRSTCSASRLVCPAARPRWLGCTRCPGDRRDPRATAARSCGSHFSDPVAGGPRVGRRAHDHPADRGRVRRPAIRRDPAGLAHAPARLRRRPRRRRRVRPCASGWSARTRSTCPAGCRTTCGTSPRCSLARGHQVGVLAPGEHVRPTSRVRDARRQGDAGARSTARWRGVAFGPRAVSRVRRWLADGEFDVLHVHEPLGAERVHAGAVGQRGAGRRRRSTRPTPGRGRCPSTASLLRPTMEKITARIAVSEAARATLVQHVGGEPIVIPNGLSCDAFATALPRPEWTAPGPTIAFLGRLDEPRKGLAVLIAGGPEPCWSVTRRPAAGGRSRRTAETGRRARRTSTSSSSGQVSDDDRARLLSLRSTSTSHRRPVARASASCWSRPWLPAPRWWPARCRPSARCSEDGAPDELFGVGDPVDLADQVVGLLRDPAARTGLAQAGSDGVRRFDWSRVGAEVVAVYETVVRAAAR